MFRAERQQSCQVVIANQYGKTVNTVTRSITLGLNELALEMSALPSGAYTVSVVSQAGTFAQRIIKTSE